MSFQSVAEFYDSVNGSAYEKYAEMLIGDFSLADMPVREVLDLGCGTGGISAILADRGYDMVALDISPEMLNIARERNFGKNMLLLCQDMRDFELYGTVQAVFSSFDCLNYILEPDELRRVFELVHNYLEPGGVFIFDINTEYRFKSVLNEKSYIYEFDNSFTAVRGEYNGESKLLTLLTDSFFEERNGKYSRISEEQTQKFHSEADIMSAVDGLFELISKSGGKGFDGCTEPEKEYYIFRRGK